MVVVYYLISTTTAWFTFYLNRRRGMGAVRASSLIALICGGIYQFMNAISDHALASEIPSIIIGSTFIGMITSRKHIKNFHLFIAPLFFVILYLHLSKEFNHFGGALGTAACISLILTIFLRSLRITKYMIRPFRFIKYRLIHYFK